MNSDEEIKVGDDEKINFKSAFKSRHLNEEIEGIELYEEIYGKEKVRTLHVLLVLCLNLAVDPPDLLAKISPCAKIEAWLDPREKNLARALEVIGKNLQSQYERWQPKARYRQCLDPTIDEVHRLCQSLRRSARDERFLFHYNGHGVPRPTENGEIWVFNKTYTKYIPLSLYDLQSWMGGPSVYVFDCNNAGRIIKMMETVTTKRQDSNNVSATLSHMESNIILAACQENEDIPMNPEIPADLFTSCLTTPIKMALHWYLLRNKVYFPDYLDDSLLDLIGGSPSNRLSMFGEINWVFTAVTDTIAWSCLPTPLFQRLFRQDLLVASLFRNFLLAERIMHYYGVRPQSYPVLPPTCHHPMWDAWDHALDGYMSQLQEIKRKKEMTTLSDNEENLPIIRHPPDDPPYVSSYNPQSNDSSDEDDDDMEEDEDSLQVKINPDQFMPRSILMTQDFSDATLNKNERYFTNKNTQSRNNVNMEGTVVNRTQFNNQSMYNEGYRGNTNDVNKDSNPSLLYPKVHIIPSLPPVRCSNQSLKSLGSVKSNNISALNGPSSDFIPFRHTDFFNDHMTAFDLWLKTADEKKPVPIQLPILLQVLLSQVHRHRALCLISKYMDLGQWAVVQCLTVGIFPYVIRLLQSPVSDVKPYLIFIWGKIISSAQTDFAKNDVVKDAGYKYFVSCLIENEPYELIVKTIAVFALAKMLNNNPVGQKLYIKQNITTVLLSELEANSLDNESFVRLKIWFILCFAKLWSENDEAKWYGVRQNINEKLLAYLKDNNPEVRAATVYAFGTFLNNKADDGIRSKHAVQVEQNVCQYLLNISVHDSSPLVRAELVVTMKYMVNLFSAQVVSMAMSYDDWINAAQSGPSISPTLSRNIRSRRGSIQELDPFMKYRKVQSVVSSTKTDYSRQKSVSNGDLPRDLRPYLVSNKELVWIYNSEMITSENISLQRTGQKLLMNESINGMPSVSTFTTSTSSFPICNLYAQMWGSLIQLSKDPHPKVSGLASQIVHLVEQYIRDNIAPKDTVTIPKDTLMEPPGSPKFSRSPVLFKGLLQMKHSTLYTTHKHKVDQITSLVSSDNSSEASVYSSEENYQFDFSNVTTDFFNWSCTFFTRPMLPGHRLTMNILNSSLKNKPKTPQYYDASLDKSRSFDKVSFKNLPNLSLIDQRAKTSSRRLLHVVEVAKYEDRTDRLKKQQNMRKDGELSWRKAVNSPSGCVLSQVFLQKMDSKPELMKFHPYLNYLAVADNCGVSLWNWESGHRAQYMLSRSVSCKDDIDGDQMVDRFITSLEFINSEEERGGLLLVGTMDGKIKIWKNYLRDMGQDPDIVTAWHAIPDPIGSERPAGLVTHWSQLFGQLTIAGDVRHIRLWDNVQEAKIKDMNTNCDSCVTSLDRTKDGRLILAGFGDGHIKMFDIRAPANECTINAGVGDSGWIHKVAFSEHNYQVHSVGINGEMTSWSLRQRSQPKTYPTQFHRHNASKKEAGNIANSFKTIDVNLGLRNDVRLNLVKLESHFIKAQSVLCADLRVTSENERDHLAIMGCGKEFNGIMTADVSTGLINSNFKFYEGFSRATIDTPSAVCVHPYQNLVGAGLEDCNLLLLKLQSK